jgi:hypothetical protein
MTRVSTDDTSGSHGLPAPGLERVADGCVQVGPALDVGATAEGTRRLVPILSGTFRGLLSGRVLPGAPTISWSRVPRPRFETAAKSLSWLMESMFVGTAQRAPDHVQLGFFRVL